MFALVAFNLLLPCFLTQAPSNSSYLQSASRDSYCISNSSKNIMRQSFIFILERSSKVVIAKIVSGYPVLRIYHLLSTTFKQISQPSM